MAQITQILYVSLEASGCAASLAESLRLSGQRDQRYEATPLRLRRIPCGKPPAFRPTGTGDVRLRLFSCAAFLAESLRLSDQLGPEI